MACYALAAQAQLAVTVSPVKIAGQRVIVPLAITNNLPQSVESVRVMCAVMNEQGKLVGQTAQWVVGGAPAGAALPSKAGTTYNFIVTSPQPLVGTNLSPKIVVSRVVLEPQQVVDPGKVSSVTFLAK